MAEHSQPSAWESVERDRVTGTDVAWAMRDLQRAHLDCDAEIARRLGMRQLDYDAMGYVMDEPGDVGPADLSSRLGISTGSATELVDRLERLGHVRRRRHPADRRRVVVEPTPGAVDDVLAVIAPLRATLDDLASTFSDEEQATITRYLRAAAGRVRAYVEGPPGGT